LNLNFLLQPGLNFIAEEKNQEDFFFDWRHNLCLPKDPETSPENVFQAWIHLFQEKEENKIEIAVPQQSDMKKQVKKYHKNNRKPRKQKH